MTPKQAGVINIPLLHRIGIIGDPLFVNRWPIYLLLVILPLSWFVVRKTRWGLELRAAGESPQGADVTGIHVNKRRRQGLYYCGVMSGLAGAYLSVAEVGLFTTNMTAGRGFLVNTAVIFGGWTLTGTMLGCFLFGGTEALRLALPALGYRIQPQVLTALPYLLALLVMCFFARSRPAPRSLGRPFERGLV